MYLLLSELYDIKDNGKAVIHLMDKELFKTRSEAEDRLDYEITYLGPNWYSCQTSDGSAMLFRYHKNARIPERIIHYVIISDEKGENVIESVE